MDAGLSLIVLRSDFTVASLCRPCRWMPPEVLDPSDQYYEYDTVDSESNVSSSCSSPFTKQSDVYSLGMTILEVLTGKAPYHLHTYDTVVILDIICKVWALLHCCWGASPDKHPTARTVEMWLLLICCTEVCTQVCI
jgi:serine/threonine protein kinase